MIVLISLSCLQGTPNEELVVDAHDSRQVQHTLDCGDGHYFSSAWNHHSNVLGIHWLTWRITGMIRSVNLVASESGLKGMHRYWNYCGNNPRIRSWSATRV